MRGFFVEETIRMNSKKGFDSSLRTRLGGQLKSKKAKVVSGTLWPNGEFSFAYVPESVVEQTLREEYSWAALGPEERGEAPEPLDLSLLHNLPEEYPTVTCRRNLARYGLHGMPVQARKKVRSSAFLIQQRYGHRRLSFLTLTVPALPSVEQERLLSSRWHDATRYFLRRLKQLLRQAGLPPFVVGVTEIQTKRYASTGQFALHMHLVFVGRQSRYEGWKIHCHEFRSAWKEVLEIILGHSIYSEALENVQGVRKSAEGYLGKYMSKSQNEVEKVKENGDEWMLPKQWWTSTKEMKEWLKSKTFSGKVTGALLESLVLEVWDRPGVYTDIWLKRIQVDLDCFKYTAGYIGRISQDLVSDLQHLLM